MLLVKTKIGNSKLSGIGLFADQFISKGTVVQRFIEGVDIVAEFSVVEKLPQTARKFFFKYAYKHKDSGKYVLCADNARFLNHSDNPNLISNDPRDEIDVAARDIKIGEELTVNYRDFDADSENELKFDV